MQRHSFRCPYCNGRLFDVVCYPPKKLENNSNYAIMIKCWKCRRIIKIIGKNLVQTSP